MNKREMTPLETEMLAELMKLREEKVKTVELLRDVQGTMRKLGRQNKGEQHVLLVEALGRIAALLREMEEEK